MEIKINVQAVGLEKAIITLAQAIGGQGASPQSQQQQEQPVQQVQQQAQPVQQQVVPTQAPQHEVVQQQQPTPQAVPTQAPSYTQEQLAIAATQIMDAGNRDGLLQLLASFGVQALTDLQPEHFGTFATKLREMGAKI